MKRNLSIFAIFFILIFSLFSQSINFTDFNFPSLEPLFIEEKQSSELSSQEIIENALRFSECEENSPEWKYCLEKYSSLEQKILSLLAENQSQSQIAEKILYVMYENLLVQYREQQTKINVMFQNGTYNCVSSALLYFALAKSAGISVVGIKTPNHAFCSVFIDEQKIDIETTNPYGFNPGEKRVLEKTENSTKYAVIPKKYYSNRKEVSVKTFISLVGSNLTSYYVEKNDYKNAIPLGATVITFRNNENVSEILEGREIFDVPALNYSAELENKNLHNESIAWLEKVILRYGINQKTQNALDASVNNAIVYLYTQNDFLTAEQIFENHKNYISPNFQKELSQTIFLSKIQSNLDLLSDEDALKYLQGQYQNDLATEKTVKSFLDNWQEYYYLKLIQEKSNKKEFLEAAKIVDEALNFLANSRNLKNAKTQVWYNHDVEFHNLIATCVNNHQYKEALQLVEVGLSENPTSKTLQNDKRRLEQIMETR